MIEQTLVLIKPDGIYRGIAGELITRLERAGLKIVGMKMIWVDKDFSKRHYSAHLKKDFYFNLEKYITAGPVIAMALEGVEAVSVVRKIVGSTYPNEAMPGTIRGDYSHVTKAYANQKGISVCNLIHSSGSVEEAKNELMLWFDPMDMHTYKRLDEDWVR